MRQAPLKRREKYCHIQKIQHKAPHTKLHALLPDLLDSVLEFKFVRMSQGSGKQYWEGYGGKITGCKSSLGPSVPSHTRSTALQIISFAKEGSSKMKQK